MMLKMRRKVMNEPLLRKNRMGLNKVVYRLTNVRHFSYFK